MAKKQVRRFDDDDDDEMRRKYPAGYALMSFLVAVAAASLALGPDTWMEWLLLGTTMISTQAAKLALALIAGVILIGLMLPFLKHTGR